MARVIEKVPGSRFQVPSSTGAAVPNAPGKRRRSLGTWNLELFSYIEVVIKPRRSPQLLLELHKHPLVFEDVANLAVGIENVSELAGAGGTHFEARRIFSRARALDTEVAFLHHALLARTIAEVRHVRIDLVRGNLRLRPVESPREVGTRGFAIPAADAPVVIDHRDAVRFGPRRLRRTHLHARRVAALLALHRHVEKSLLRHRRRRIVVIP